MTTTNRKPRAKKQELKVAISRTYSEGRKVNIGNYESRDFFASSTRMVELPSSTPVDDLVAHGELMFAAAREEVKAALQVEIDAATGVKPMVDGPSAEEAPSVPDAFSPEHERAYPGKKFVPHDDVAGNMDDLDLE